MNQLKEKSTTLHKEKMNRSASRTLNLLGIILLMRTEKLRAKKPSGTEKNINLLKLCSDMYFHDDRTGYLVGDSVTTGVLLKCVSPVNIQTLTTPNSISWNRESLKDGFNVTSNANVSPKVIAFSDRYNGFIAGSYQSGFTNNSSYPYARLLRDEADMYSTYFNYDLLGRMVVSQNTKQFNKTPLAYSYTKYDALGRITEVGEKSENTSGHKFKNIFGTFVNGSFNPRAINNDSLNTWIADNTGARKEVTHTYYDTIQYSFLPVTQQNLRKRVVSTTYEDVDDNNRLTYNHASHFSYDIHGSVNTLIQDKPSLHNVHTGTDSMQFVRIDYEYDLVSGNVNDVHYQTGKPDAFHHHYEYDADNRITHVYTSKMADAKWTGAQGDGFWDNDAKYFYYAHGPLARVEMGDNQVQGMDYAYTLQGWIKAVNSNTLTAKRDIGHDGNHATADSINKHFAHDAFGYSLNYYNGDYEPIGTIAGTDSAIATLAHSDLLKARHDLFNGNISSMGTTITKPTTYKKDTTYKPTVLPQGTAYRYDQLNRIVEMQAYKNLVVDSNKWGLGSTYAGMYNNKFTYDGNGNILTQQRRDSAGKMINALTYNRYNVGGRTLQNRLYSVNDTVASGRFADDIDDQGTFDNTTLANVEANNNYKYDELGSLKHNTQKEIDTIKYNVYGKVKEVKRTNGSSRKNLKFDYDANQNRVAKKVYNSSDSLLFVEHYVRDAQGNVMSIYKQTIVDFAQTEKDIYGNSRLGIDKTITSMVGATVSSDTTVRYLGNKHFEGTNHLTNVLVTFTDKKIPRKLHPSDTIIDHFEPEVVSASDYYPFGITEKERTFSDNTDRYKFCGKEFDNETGTTDYGARMQDGDLGIFQAVDNLANKFAFLSPYSYAENDVIRAIDLDGLETVVIIGGADLKNEGVSKTMLGIETSVKSYAEAHNIDLKIHTVNVPEADANPFVKMGEKTSYQDAKAFIVANYKSDEPLVIYGYSYGGAVAENLANDLKKEGYKVNLLITVDANTGAGSEFEGGAKIENNVMENVNFYQEIGNLIGSYGAPNIPAEGNNTTLIINSNQTEETPNQPGIVPPSFPKAIQEMNKHSNIDEQTQKESTNLINSHITPKTENQPAPSGGGQSEPQKE